MKSSFHFLPLLLIGLVPHFSVAENEVQHLKEIEFAKPDGVSLLLDLYLPKGVESPPLLMFIHGGGWQSGDRNRCRLNWVAQHGYAVASVEYRLSDEALFPAQILDCKGALRWLRAKADDYGYDASRVVVAGTSAGGHLAALMGTSGGVAALEGSTAGNAEQSSRVQGIIDYYGPSDFVKRSENQPAKTDEPKGGVYRLLGGPVKENLDAAREASPATYISEDDPPLLIFHGDEDKTVYLDQSEWLFKLYGEAGLDVHLEVVKGSGHGWKRTPPEKEFVLTFLAKHLKKTKESDASATNLVDRFVAAWKEQKPLPALSRVAPDLDLEQAYDIQQAWVKQTIDEAGIGGIKGGVVTAGGQSFLGLTEPVGAILRASGRYEGGDSPEVLLERFPGLKLECEIGFTVKTPILKRPESIDELKPLIAGITPVIELISGDWEGPAGGKPTGQDLAAINVTAAGYIVGNPIAADSLDPKQVTLQLSHEDKLVNSAQGVDCWHGPWETALWLTQFAFDQEVQLKAGDVIICGALGKILNAEIGNYHYDAGDLGMFSFSVK